MYNELIKAILLEAEFTKLYGRTDEDYDEPLRRVHLGNLAIDGAKARLEKWCVSWKS